MRRSPCSLRACGLTPLALGIAPSTVDRAFAGLKQNPKVLELDSRAPELTQSWERYRSTRVSDPRVAAGRQAMQANSTALTEISGRYGVDPGIIVAIWGVETNYGGYTGRVLRDRVPWLP